MPQKEGSSLEWQSYGLSFSQRLRWLRNHRQLSQEKLAELAGMHRNQISNLERNVSRERDASADPHLSTIYELARALDVPPEFLLPDLGHAPTRVSRDSKNKSVIEEMLASTLADWNR